MRLLALLAAVVVTAAVVAAPVPKRGKGDAEKVVGTWHDGREGEGGYWHLEADGVAGTGGRKSPRDAEYRVDPAKNQFDWSHDGGTTWFLGVYELDEDTLRIALGRGGTGERPEGVGGQHRQYQYLTLKRVTDEKKDK